MIDKETVLAIANIAKNMDFYRTEEHYEHVLVIAFKTFAEELEELVSDD